jgi:hypothetical protein
VAALGKEDDSGTPGPARNLSGNCLGQAALRREQWEQLKSNQCENRATWKEGKVDHQMLQAQLFEKKEWMNSLKERVMWYVYLLLCNDSANNTHC